MKRLLGFAMLGLLLAAGSLLAQPQLQELALTAIAGPGWYVEAQGSRVAVQNSLGFLFFEYDSLNSTLDLMSILQIPYSSGDEMRFHPTQPLLYVLDWRHNLYFIDLTDISDPSRFDLPNMYEDYLDDFDLTDDYLFMLVDEYHWWQGWGSGIMKYNNTDPHEPFLVDSSFVHNNGNNMIIDRDFLHADAAQGPMLSRYGLHTFSDYPHIELLAYNLVPWGGVKSAGGGHSAVISDQNLWIYNISSSYPYLLGPSQYSNLGSPVQCTELGTIYAQGETGIFTYSGSTWIWTGIGPSNDFS